MLNWAGNLTYSTERIHSPRSTEEVRDSVLRATRIKVLGTRHSFNAIADTDQQFLSLEHLNRIVSFDSTADGSTVTVEGGVTYGRLCGELHARGFALHNLASLPHISVAGACATATHGSGTCNANLASAVVGMQIIDGRGNLIAVSRDHDGDRLNGIAVHLGALGVVTQLTLRVSPTFDLAQEVFENLPQDVLRKNFNAIATCGYSVSLFTDWRGDSINQVWVKRRIGAPGSTIIHDLLSGA